MPPIIKSAAIALLLAGTAPGVSAATDDTAPSAQSLLFDAEYLVPLGAPSRLLYGYSSKTADPALFGQDFDDEVTLRLTATAEGGGQKDVLVDMFTGERQRVLGPLTRVGGNPIIMMFLERDVSQMNLHIGGAAVYFRNVIRMAFRDKARLEPASFTWDGRAVTGTKITIQPFLADPNGQRMQLFRTKTYAFIVSDAVPGGIYQMHSTMADERADAAAAPAIDITLTLKGIAYDQPKN
jgi:hypothetical protein